MIEISTTGMLHSLKLLVTSHRQRHRMVLSGAVGTENYKSLSQQAKKSFMSLKIGDNKQNVVSLEFSKILYISTLKSVKAPSYNLLNKFSVYLNFLGEGVIHMILCTLNLLWDTVDSCTSPLQRPLS